MKLLESKEAKEHHLEDVVNQLFTRVERVIFYFQSELGLTLLTFETPRFSHKFVNSVQHQALFRIILDWYKQISIIYDENGNIRSPVKSITDIFEHFCLIEIVDIFKELGFEQKHADLSLIELIKKEQSIKIHYQMQVVDKKNNNPIYTSKNASHLKPDIVIEYEEISGSKRIGVIDPKFSNKKNIKIQAEKINFFFQLKWAGLKKSSF